MILFGSVIRSLFVPESKDNVTKKDLVHIYIRAETGKRKGMIWTQVSSRSLVSDQIRSYQSLSCVRLFATPWIAAPQVSLSITNSQSSLRLTSIESLMPSSHLILCHPLLLLPPIPPSIRVFSNESTLLIRWPKYWSFSFSISPSKEIPGLILQNGLLALFIIGEETIL